MELLYFTRSGFGAMQPTFQKVSDGSTSDDTIIRFCLFFALCQVATARGIPAIHHVLHGLFHPQSTCVVLVLLFCPTVVPMMIP